MMNKSLAVKIRTQVFSRKEPKMHPHETLEKPSLANSKIKQKLGRTEVSFLTTKQLSKIQGWDGI